jgi:hypothetical protein
MFDDAFMVLVRGVMGVFGFLRVKNPLFIASIPLNWN